VRLPQPSHASITASYRTLFRLASGGMGSVDLAIRHEGAFERLFAVKRLKPELLGEPEVRAMLLEEARLAGRVQHPNVVSVIDLGEDEQGPFLVMDYVEGVSAADLVSATAPEQLPLSVCLRIARDVAEGLHAAHELCEGDGSPLRLVHRDVSPQNVLVGYDGVARVTDFGIAKALGRTTGTSTGVLKGKLAYMAPEQLRFEEPDRRADLFALGVVLFELLSGQRLYRTEHDMDGPRRILTEPPPDLGDFRDDAEPELVELLMELLAKDRASRPPTAKAVARRLDALLAAMQLDGDPVETAEFLGERFAKVRERRRAAVADAVERAREKSRARAGTTASGMVLGPALGAELGAPPRSRAARGVLVGVAMMLVASGVWLALRHAAPPAASSAGPRSAAATPAAVTRVSAGPVETTSAVVASGAPAVSANADARRPAARARRFSHAPTNPSQKPSGVPLWEHY
jgi:serine/threonine-protein kinase